MQVIYWLSYFSYSPAFSYQKPQDRPLPRFVDVVQLWLVEQELSISSVCAVHIQDSVGYALSVNV
jgi:hypothetical protein